MPRKDKEADKQYQREYRARNKEKIRLYRQSRQDITRRKNRLYYVAHKEEVKRRINERGRNLKLEVFAHYSPNLKCQNSTCAVLGGMGDIRALSIDHVNGGGSKHFKEIGRAGGRFYRWLKRNNYPNGFQVLCMNCQFVKRVEKQEYRVI